MLVKGNYHSVNESENYFRKNPIRNLHQAPKSKEGKSCEERKLQRKKTAKKQNYIETKLQRKKTAKKENCKERKLQRKKTANRSIVQVQPSSIESYDRKDNYRRDITTEKTHLD